VADSDVTLGVLANSEMSRLEKATKSWGKVAGIFDFFWVFFWGNRVT